MAVEKLTEFARDGQKNTDELDLEVGFVANKKPARQWFNWIFNNLTLKINELIDADYVQKSNVIDNLTTDDATKPVSAKQAKTLQDNKLDKSTVASTSQKGIVQLVDDLTSGGADKSLSAEQGKALLNMFASSQNITGYQKIPNPISPEKPLIIQWGGSLVNKGSLLDITLPIAYPNSHLRAFGILESDGLVSNAIFSICATPQSKSTIRLSNSSGSGSAALASWFSIGC